MLSARLALLHLHYCATGTYDVDDRYLCVYEASRAHEQRVHACIMHGRGYNGQLTTG